MLLSNAIDTQQISSTSAYLNYLNATDPRGEICMSLQSLLKIIQMDCEQGLPLEQVKKDEQIAKEFIENHAGDLPKVFTETGRFDDWCININQEYVPGQRFPTDLYPTLFELGDLCSAVFCLTKVENDLNPVNMDALKQDSSWYSDILPSDVLSKLNAMISSPTEGNLDQCMEAIQNALKELYNK
jgi:hypothetical protein